jgi:hypothetical protein
MKLGLFSTDVNIFPGTPRMRQLDQVSSCLAGHHLRNKPHI